MPEPVAYVWFTDAVKQAVYEDDRGEYVIAEDGEEVRGIWFMPREEANSRIVVHNGPRSTRN
jgi:hypothetical protein